MSEHYREYIVNTDSVPHEMQRVREHLQQAAGILLTVSTFEDGHTSTLEITFVPEEIPKSGFVFSRGKILPDNTEATLKTEDNAKYLVLIAAIDHERSSTD